jgi:hypothetical protein
MSVLHDGSTMTTDSASVGSTGSQIQLAGELLDALVEAVMHWPDARVRSAVISSLVQEMCAAVEWLHGSDALNNAADQELVSLRRVVAAAQDHQERMRSPAPTGSRWEQS